MGIYFLYIIYFIMLNICVYIYIYILYNKIYKYKYIYWVPKIWEYVQDFVLGVFKQDADAGRQKN